MRILHLVLLLGIFTVGCATIKGGTQNLKLSSSPDGAIVLDKSGKQLCVTPCFVEIDRDVERELIFHLSGYKDEKVTLTSFYRWGNSFFSNFIWFFYGAPIGWATDLATGSAWEYRRVPKVNLKSGRVFDEDKVAQANQIKEKNFSKIVAIAPPQEGFGLLSDEIGETLEVKLKARYPHYKIIPYQATLDTFELYGYSNSQRTLEEYRNDLYFNLGADFILESETVRSPKRVDLVAQLTDVYSDKYSDSFATEYANSQLKNARKSAWQEALYNFINVVPNNFGYDIAGASLDFNAGEVGPNAGPGSYIPIPDRPKNFWLLLSGINAGSVKSPFVSDKYNVLFRLVPDVRINYNHLFFSKVTGENYLYGISFDWYTYLIGVGPELGVETPIGYLYYHFIPDFGLSQVIYTKDSTENVSNGWGLHVKGELGYRFFISNNTNLKLFYQSVSGLENQWSAILSHASGGRSIEVRKASYGSVGLSFGYYFPSLNTDIKRKLK